MSGTELFIIGLTGPSGAGKSLVASLMSGYGFPVIDADAVYHELLIPPSKCLDALVEAFSGQILNPDGTLNRPALSRIVFEDSDAGREKKAQLNRITHRFVIEETHRRLDAYRAQGVRCAVIDAPLLLEANMHRDCNFTVAVLADKDVRLHRLLARDHATEQAILSRMRAQPDDEFYRSQVDAVLYNNGDTAAIEADVLALCRRLGVLT